MANVLLSTKAVGSTVKLKVNGTAKEFIVVHQGKPSSLYDDSCNGTWLLMKDIYENRVWQSGNINKYESSDIHTYLNNTFLNLFESNIRDAIKQVKIQSQGETAGVGTKIENESFWSQYTGLPAETITLDQQVDRITGASISSSAVNDAVNFAIAAYNAIS